MCDSVRGFGRVGVLKKERELTDWVENILFVSRAENYQRLAFLNCVRENESADLRKTLVFRSFWSNDLKLACRWNDRRTYLETQRAAQL